MNVAIIPARGGSRRIPGKNIRLFHGKPILAYSIEAARASGLFDKIIVSTEDEKVKAVARAYQAKIHQRPLRLAADDIGTQEVARATILWWVNSPNTMAIDEACVIYPTAPMLAPAELRAAKESIKQGYPYAYVPGIFYYGRAEEFVREVPLELGIEMPIDQDRHIDINTEDDWQRAERRYSEITRHACV